MTIHSWNRFNYLEEPFQKPHKVRTLTLMEANASDLVHALPLFTNLIKLCLNWYAGRELPVVVWQLPKLRVLGVLNTPVEHLPDSVPEGLRLTEFAVRQGDLVSLPPWLTQMRSLVHLDFWQNTIRQLPDDIGNLSQLKFFRCGCNEIARLPDSIGDLKKLRLLDVRNNKLTTVPSTLFQLRKLSYVNFGGNPLETKVEQEVRRLVQRRWKRIFRW